jgi:pimeloyl-ACP methyl ester carboxylesterase
MASQAKQRIVRASNINFTVLEAGEGPLVLCLHGFPDTAHSFRHQMPVLAAAGYHCVAPFMRGYSPTEPAPDGRYDTGALSEDALGLITALGYKDAILFGHDWGAVAAYEVDPSFL